MAKLKKFETLIAQQEEYWSYFPVNASDDVESIRKTLLLLASMEGNEFPQSQEFHTLKAKEIKKLAQFYQNLTSKAPVQKEAKKYTDKDFYYSLAASSPYQKEIVLDKQLQRPFSDLSSFSNEPQVKSIQGHVLAANETFVSTRYYSEDNEQFSQVLYKNGVFTGVEKNLNKEQQADLAIEMITQFLMNTSNPTGIKLSGPEESVHKMQAAFLYLKKECGALWDAKFSHLHLELPSGVALQESYDEQYIQTHLGDFSLYPRQLSQLQRFLSPNEGAKKKSPSFVRFKFPILLENEALSIADKDAVEKALVTIDRHLDKNQYMVPQSLTLEEQREKEVSYLEQIQVLLDCVKKYPDLEKMVPLFEKMKAASEELAQKFLDKISTIHEEYLEKSEPFRKQMEKEGGQFVAQAIGYFESLVSQQGLTSDVLDNAPFQQLKTTQSFSLSHIAKASVIFNEIADKARQQGIEIPQNLAVDLEALNTWAKDFKGTPNQQENPSKIACQDMRERLKAMKKPKETLSLSEENRQKVKEWVGRMLSGMGSSGISLGSKKLFVALKQLQNAQDGDLNQLALKFSQKLKENKLIIPSTLLSMDEKAQLIAALAPSTEDSLLDKDGDYEFRRTF